MIYKCPVWKTLSYYVCFFFNSIFLHHFILFYLLLAIQHVGSYKVPQPRIEPMFLAVEAWSLNHWTSSCCLVSLRLFSLSSVRGFSYSGCTSLRPLSLAEMAPAGATPSPMATLESALLFLSRALSLIPPLSLDDSLWHHHAPIVHHPGLQTPPLPLTLHAQSTTKSH